MAISSNPEIRIENYLRDKKISHTERLERIRKLLESPFQNTDTPLCRKIRDCISVWDVSALSFSKDEIAPVLRLGFEILLSDIDGKGDFWRHKDWPHLLVAVTTMKNNTKENL